MKNYFTLIILTFCCFSFTQAQERYLEEVFTDVEVTTEIYGVNATVLFLPIVMETVPIPLPMDIYRPAGDTETDRPMVLLFHTGNFLPNVTNGQISGTRQDSSVVEYCKMFARRGYVAASCDYRRGWNPLAPTQPERALGLIQAAYRGVQDGRNAVRYAKATSANLGIDTSKIVVMGVGTGGYLTLGMVGLSDYSEIIQTTNGPAKFLLDLNGDNTPETPMVIPAFHGDINGTVLTVTPDDGSSVGFGLPPGDTTNYVNIANNTNDFALGINVGGALGDVSWLNDNTTPTISVQSPFDIFAPYDDDVLIVPTTGDPIVQVQGALQIGMAQEANGANGIFTAAGVNFSSRPTTQMAMDNSATAGHPYYEGVFPFIMPANSSGIPEGVVIDWWDPNAPSPADGAGMGIPWNMLPHPTDPSGMTSYHEQGLVLNEGMSAEKARANINLTMDYILPRACVALELPCQWNFIDSGSEDIIKEDFVTISPNPAADFTIVNTSERIIQEAQLTNLKGELLRSYKNVNDNFLQVDRADLNTGIYIVQLRFEEGMTSKKVVFK